MNESDSQHGQSTRTVNTASSRELTPMQRYEQFIRSDGLADLLTIGVGDLIDELRELNAQPRPDGSTYRIEEVLSHLENLSTHALNHFNSHTLRTFTGTSEQLELILSPSDRLRNNNGQLDFAAGPVEECVVTLSGFLPSTYAQPEKYLTRKNQQLSIHSRQVSYNPKKSSTEIENGGTGVEFSLNGEGIAEVRGITHIGSLRCRSNMISDIGSIPANQEIIYNISNQISLLGF
ncbi:MAG: hypothetical protein WCO06_02020 [Candidatus Roizmanbacteria bacterium]